MTFSCPSFSARRCQINGRTRPLPEAKVVCQSLDLAAVRAFCAISTIFFLFLYLFCILFCISFFLFFHLLFSLFSFSLSQLSSLYKQIVNSILSQLRSRFRSVCKKPSFFLLNKTWFNLCTMRFLSSSLLRVSQGPASSFKYLSSSRIRRHWACFVHWAKETCNRRSTSITYMLKTSALWAGLTFL